MKIAFLYSRDRFTAKLTKWFTGSYCYHIGFVDDATDSFYEMSLQRRIRMWSRYSLNKEYKLIDTPVTITKDFLDYKLKTDSSVYGLRDYFLFAIRPIYHLFGKSTRNAGGIICSEMVYNDLVECGWRETFPEVPSPADLERVLL